MQRLTLITLLILLCFVSHAQKYTIIGYLKDSNTSENLISASVYNLTDKSGTSTNSYGFYSITLPAGQVEVTFSYVGYTTQVVPFNLQKDTVININLTAENKLDDVVVTARRSRNIQESTQMSSVDIPISQIKSIPAFLGEVDLMKVLQLTPGVQSGGEGSSGLYVRGGGPDQNLILLDGVPVYNASHLFGFFSVFNADAINNVELLKGGFPARYGGRISSVIDINMKEGNAKKFSGEGGIGIVASRLTLEGPIIKDRTSFIVSARRTYVDLIMKPIIKAEYGDDVGFGYYFYDLTAKINHKFSDKDRIYLSAYMGDDKFNVEDNEDDSYGDVVSYNKMKAGMTWGNITTAFRWNHIYTTKLFGNTTLTYSRYRCNMGIRSEERYNYEHESYNLDYFSGIKDWAAKVNFDYLPSPDHYVRFGGGYIYHTFKPGIMGVKSSAEEVSNLGSSSVYSNEFSFFAEDDFRIGKKLKANLGVHWSGVNVKGKFYSDFQPRLAVRYLIDPELSFKASYSKMAQYVHLLTNSGISLPMDLWVPATKKLKPQYSEQIAAGFAKSFKNMYEISIEGYYKKMKNVIEYKEGVSYFDIDDRWEMKVEQGEGTSYGIEVFAQKRIGAFTGWVGYTFSKTERTFDNLNSGRVYPYKYDRRHDVSLVGIYRITKGIEISATWVYGTGNAITVPIATVYDPVNSTEVKLYGEKNAYRMAPYHRLDLGVNFIKKTRWGESTWSIGVYNAYNRQNPFFIDLKEKRNDYVEELNSRKFIQYSLFPIIPSVSYSFKF